MRQRMRRGDVATKSMKVGWVSAKKLFIFVGQINRFLQRQHQVQMIITEIRPLSQEEFKEQVHPVTHIHGPKNKAKKKEKKK